MSDQSIEQHRFRKKPVVIEAIQYTDPSSVLRIMDAFGSMGVNNTPDGLKIITLEGTMTAAKGDWIIRGIKGEIYPCKPEIFAATYEPISCSRENGQDEQRLREIREREAAATPGPWCVNRDGDIARHDNGGDVVFAALLSAPYDREFVSKARTDIPWLLAQLAELEAEVQHKAKGS